VGVVTSCTGGTAIKRLCQIGRIICEVLGSKWTGSPEAQVLTANTTVFF
jgi:hypothetical protein